MLMVGVIIYHITSTNPIMQYSPTPIKIGYEHNKCPNLWLQ